MGNEENSQRLANRSVDKRPDKIGQSRNHQGYAKMTYELAISNRTRSTPYTSRNAAAGVKAYTVYNNMLLPTRFRTDFDDYWHLCENVQVWDVSCERQIQLTGPDANRLVQWMTPRDISLARAGQCFYLPLCDENGRIINDPVAIRVDENTWWLSIADSEVCLWARGLALGRGLDVEVSELDVWPLAVQGPKAEELVARVFGDEVRNIRFFRYLRLPYKGRELIVARSGWSKQGGFEVYVDDAVLGGALWDEFFEQGEDLAVGPGCPNLIERIESGLLSFGNDMDYRHNVFECGLDKFCHLDRDLPSMSIAALREIRAQGIERRLVGLVSAGLEVMPVDTVVSLNGADVGHVTSSCISARYDAWLGFAMLEVDAIAAASSEAGVLSVQTQSGLECVHCTEIPFDFQHMKLTLRNRGSDSGEAISNATALAQLPS